MAGVSDDDIIKRKLLIDGDGGNDDRRISGLMKTYLKWCSATSEDDINTSYQRMLGILAQAEYAAQKSYNISKMNKKEQQHYEKLTSDIDERVEDAMEKIAECKNELQQAKRIRKNRQEYDALARVIQQHPDRLDTIQKLADLDKEFKEMKETKESLEQKLELRRKQFHVLITLIHEMQRILEEDDEKKSVDEKDKDAMDTT